MPKKLQTVPSAEAVLSQSLVLYARAGSYRDSGHGRYVVLYKRIMNVFHPTPVSCLFNLSVDRMKEN